MAAQWATIAQIAELTGRTVTDATRRHAVATLEAMLGLIEEIERPDITDRDRYWLRLATAYQAAWIADNPDLFSRADVTSASQDGESANFRNVDAHLLAPLARKAIRRLSWRQPNRAEQRAAASAVNVNSEAFDDSLPWRPM